MGLQLGLKIIKSLNGYQEVAEINGDSRWTKKVRDTRDDCKVIEGLNEDSKSSVIMYTADETGEYYAIVSLIDGRDNDFISAWIFRPWGLIISGKELLNVIESVRSEILASEINEDNLNKIFASIYPESEAAVSPICTEGHSPAVRYYNKKGADYSLSEIFDRGVAQKVNANYKAVFLVDCAMGLNASGCIDISSSTLEQSISIYPPSSKILADANGFLPYINGERFERPLSVIAGSEITVVWKKEGFADITSKYKCKEDKASIGAPGLDAIKRIIPIDRIRVINDLNDPVKNCRIRIEKKDIPNEGSIPVSEHIVREALIEVTCDGYNAYSKKHDLTQPVKIPLKSLTYSYKFTTSGRDEQTINFEITTKHVLERTPLLGYHSRDRQKPRDTGVNVIEYRPDGVSYKLGGIIAAIIFVLGIAIGAYGFWLINDWFTPSKQHKQEQDYKFERRSESPAPAENTLEKAIKYLNDHEEWEKNDMEKIPELQGLWDELNTFNFTKIKTRSSLLASYRYRNLIAKIDALLEATQGKPTFRGEKYNNKDLCITIEKRDHPQDTTYFNFLDSKIVEAKSKMQKGSSGGKVSGAVKSKSGSQKKVSSNSNPSEGAPEKGDKEDDKLNKLLGM